MTNETTSACTYADVLAAREKVYRHLHATPLHPYAGLSELVGAEVYVKHENHHAVGAFKVRGGVNLAAHLAESGQTVGLYTASTGNHGQSIAFAGKVVAGYLVRWREFNRLAVGIGMVPRGEVGLIFANIGLTTGVLSQQLFSAILLMVIGTTFVGPPLLKWSFARGGMTDPPTGPPS